MMSLNKNLFPLYLITVLFLIFYSCSGQGDKPGENQATADRLQPQDSLVVVANQYFKTVPKMVPNPDNEITARKVALGKMLFFDTRLSKSNTISCNSCHNLATFGVDNNPKSMGHGWKLGGRNAPTVLNAALHISQFWDGRAQDVEEQAKGPIMNPVEMAMTSPGLAIDRISTIPEYVSVFKEVFPNDRNPVTYDNIANAIGAFERTLITPSRFDRFMVGDVASLNKSEKRGLALFVNSGCTSCHNGVAIGGGMYQKFGLVQSPYWKYTKATFHDEGRFDVTKANEDKFVFKVPSLRNSTHTYPYFHDGSIWKIRDAVEIMGKTQLGKTLSIDDVDDIVAFLNSLTGEIPEEALKLPILPPSGPDTPKPNDF